MQRRNRFLSGTLVLLAVAGLTFTSTPAAAAGTARPGASGVGDYLFPNLGNGGYDAKHYTLNLHYPTAEPVQPVDGTITMDAVATENLSSFNLDFAGDKVTSVRVNGHPAQFDWQQTAEELVITPGRALCRGRFSVEVGFTSQPTAPAPDNLFPVGWIAAERHSFTSFQPDTAHRSFPVNDHPSDKATWTFKLDVPDGVTAVANGLPINRDSAKGRTKWTYDERNPLASELIQLAVGDDLSVVQRGKVDGVTYRDVIANGRRDLLEPAFAQIPAELAWAIDRFGEFPNSIYGNLGVDLYFGYALETQGLSLQSVGLFDPEFLPGRTGQWWFWSSVAHHEITHEWFGNAVSPVRWADLWLNEGFATYSMKLREDENGTIDEWGNPSLEDYMKEQYAQGDIWRVQYGPVARPLSAEVLFSPQAYDGGALVLYALRQEIGEEKFDAILRGWPQRNRGRSVSTDDFIAYASEMSGRDLQSFLRAWVYGAITPTMPGHPDWTVNPVTATTTSGMQAKTPAGRHGWASAA